MNREISERLGVNSNTHALEDCGFPRIRSTEASTIHTANAPRTYVTPGLLQLELGVALLRAKDVDKAVLLLVLRLKGSELIQQMHTTTRHAHLPGRNVVQRQRARCTEGVLVVLHVRVLVPSAPPAAPSPPRLAVPPPYNLHLFDGGEEARSPLRISLDLIEVARHLVLRELVREEVHGVLPPRDAPHYCRSFRAACAVWEWTAGGKGSEEGGDSRGGGGGERWSV